MINFRERKNAFFNALKKIVEEEPYPVLGWRSFPTGRLFLYLRCMPYHMIKANNELELPFGEKVLMEFEDNLEKLVIKRTGHEDHEGTDCRVIKELNIDEVLGP